VRHGPVAEDVKLGDVSLKCPIAITLIDQFCEERTKQLFFYGVLLIGGAAQGIDGGGVFKEFSTDLSKERKRWSTAIEDFGSPTRTS